MPISKSVANTTDVLRNCKICNIKMVTLDKEINDIVNIFVFLKLYLGNAYMILSYKKKKRRNKNSIFHIHFY